MKSWARPLTYIGTASVARAVLLALVAAGVEAELSLGFFFTWTVMFLAVTLPVSALEAPAASRAATWVTLKVALSSVLWAWVLGSLFPHLEVLGLWGAGAWVVGGLCAVGLTERIPVAEAQRAQTFTFALWLLPLAAALLVSLVNPERAHRQRWQHNAAQLGPLSEPPRETKQWTDRQLAEALAQHWLSRREPQQRAWTWETMVALEGVLELSRLDDDFDAARYTQDWAIAHQASANGARGVWWADSAAPFAPARRALGVLSEQSTLTEEFFFPLEDYLANHAPRTQGGTLSHTGFLLQGVVPTQAWVDSLFMHGMYFLHLAAQEHPSADWAMREAERLGQGMAMDLQQSNGLFRHARLELGLVNLTLPTGAAFWGRGNGWAAVFLSRLHRVWAKREREPPQRLTRSWVRLARALLRAQETRSGLWRTDLLRNGHDNNLETSASALFVAALASACSQSLPPFDGPQRATAVAQVNRARRALRGRIAWSKGGPVVIGTSTGTNPGFGAAYRAVPTAPDVAHGVGAMLLALSSPACEVHVAAQ